MIQLIPDAIYTLKEVVEKLQWDPRTVRRAARRIGKKPYTRFFTADDVRRMAVNQ